MKKSLIFGLALVVVSALVMTACKSMTIVSIDNESVTGPKRVRQYGVIDPKDISIYAFFKDGNRKTVSIYKQDITFDSGRTGRQEVKVNARGFPVSFETEVMALTGLTAAPQPLLRKFGVSARVPKSSGMTYGAPAAPGNDENYWPGLEIQGVWDQMGSEKLTDAAIKDECQFSGFDPVKAGKQAVIVAWKGKQTTFNVEVVAMASIKVTSLPKKTTYYQGENLDPTGIKVVGVWPGISEEVISNYNYTGYDMKKVGKQTVTVTQDGKSAIFGIEVLDILGILNGKWKVEGTGVYSLQEFQFNNGAFDIKYGAEEPFIQIKGTYTIVATVDNKDIDPVTKTTGGVWHGKVTFTATNPAQQTYMINWKSFIIGTDTNILGTVYRGTGLTFITDQTSPLRLTYVKQ